MLPNLLPTDDFNKLVAARYGVLCANTNDTVVGLSVLQYGEYFESEVELFRQIVRPGMVVADVGANIGLDAGLAREPTIPSAVNKRPRSDDEAILRRRPLGRDVLHHAVDDAHVGPGTALRRRGSAALAGHGAHRGAGRRQRLEVATVAFPGTAIEFGRLLRGEARRDLLVPVGRRSHCLHRPIEHLQPLRIRAGVRDQHG